jgi:aryl-alcohol dehydrogenase-like predicted oxidoreductase
MAHMAVAFTLAHPAVTSAIVGPRTPDQIEDLTSAADLRLDDATLDAIDAVVAPGTTVDEVDRGFSPWWLAAAERRRRSV